MSDFTVYTSSYQPVAQYPGLWYSQRDMGTLQSFNSEIFGSIVQCLVWLFKVCPTETQNNIYGETNQQGGKFYFPPVEMTTLVEKSDPNSKEEDVGPDRDQLVTFRFREAMLMAVNFYPQEGDVILFNERYHEIDSPVTQEQFLGGVAEKSWSIICKTHYARFSKINIIDRNN